MQAQIFAATVPRQLENVKELLLSIVHILSPGRAAKEVFLFVNRIVDLSMNILILLEAKEDMPNIQVESLHQCVILLLRAFQTTDDLTSQGIRRCEDVCRVDKSMEIVPFFCRHCEKGHVCQKSRPRTTNTLDP